MTTVIFLAGLSLIVAGTTMIFLPAGLIAAGTGLSGLAFRYELGGDR